MATVTTQIQDGYKNVIVDMTLEGGTDETDTTMVDFSALSSGAQQNPFTELKLMKLDAIPVLFTITFKWNATANYDFIRLSPDEPVSFDFRPSGGLINHAGAGKNGDVLFTTSGIGAGEVGWFRFWFEKR